VSPREAARTENGRPKLVEWLEGIETWMAEEPGYVGYDFDRIWQELGFADLRKKTK
jgi:hypothetical protein